LIQNWNEEHDMSLSGEWWNELGSKMVIDPPGSNKRIITGTYHTAVGTAKQRDYPLAGACDDAGGPNKTIGWAVAFDPPDPPDPGEPPHGPSTCAWSGQLQYVGEDEDTLEFIETSWYLTSATDVPDDWESTQAGKDYFFRERPTPEMIGRAILGI
jgi:Avidin family